MDGFDLSVMGKAEKVVAFDFESAAETFVAAYADKGVDGEFLFGFKFEDGVALVGADVFVCEFDGVVDAEVGDAVAVLFNFERVEGAACFNGVLFFESGTGGVANVNKLNVVEFDERSRIEGDLEIYIGAGFVEGFVEDGGFCGYIRVAIFVVGSAEGI